MLLERFQDEFFVAMHIVDQVNIVGASELLHPKLRLSADVNGLPKPSAREIFTDISPDTGHRRSSSLRTLSISSMCSMVKSGSATFLSFLPPLVMMRMVNIPASFAPFMSRNVSFPMYTELPGFMPSLRRHSAKRRTSGFRYPNSEEMMMDSKKSWMPSIFSSGSACSTWESETMPSL